jgi:hypothetical protein
MTSRRLLLPAVFASLALLYPGGAGAADSASTASSQSRPARPATVKVKVLGLDNGRARILSRVRIVGTLTPFARGEEVKLRFFRNGHRFRERTVKVQRARGHNYGVFRTRFYLRKAARYAVSARHVATRALGGDHTVRKQWGVSFPSIGAGECGRVVRGFRRALRRLGYVAGSGSCFSSKPQRAVLAYRKVNGLSRNSHAGKRLVKDVFWGRGGYRVRHPGAGEHVEVSLSKQVLVFANGDDVQAIYPVSTGAAATPTVTGHFEFYGTQPGYNSVGMYYSFYFYGGYAIHGYHSVPNYPASHGCVRTFIADQPEIYNRIFYGEDIFVF